MISQYNARPSDQAAADEWMHRLKQAYDAGYYKTEAAPDAQSAFPWQNKWCKDCPFWQASVCHVFGEYRRGLSHTCAYFDAPNHESAQQAITERRRHGLQAA
jgi:hypothetical protein